MIKQKRKAKADMKLWKTSKVGCEVAFSRVRKVFEKQLIQFVYCQLRDQEQTRQLVEERFKAAEMDCKTYESIDQLGVYLFVTAQFALIKKGVFPKKVLPYK